MAENPRSRREAQLARLEQRIEAVDATEAARRMAEGARLLDVREPDETADGLPEGAEALPRGWLEMRIDSLVPDPDTPILVLCGSGTRSLLAAETLTGLGYRNVTNVRGGFKAWKDAGLPVHRPAAGADQRARYRGQINLPEIGEAGQARLAGAKVLLVGTGGLGSPAALYLAAAGIGTLGLVDDDHVERSNLHRQVLHTEARIGMPKVYSAQAALAERNSQIRVVPHLARVSADNAAELAAGYDLVIDGSDNFPTRYALSDACTRLGLPLLHASAYRFEGQLMVLWPARGGPCYRCIFPEAPPAELAPACSETGVLGPLTGLLGVLQAAEAVKLLLGIGHTPLDRLLCVDTLSGEFRSLRVRRDPACPACGTAAAGAGA